MKKSILKTILFLTIIGASTLVNAQKKKLSIKGDEEICLQNNETFEYEYSTRKFKSIHWSATNGTDIKSVDGFDLKAVIEDFISGNTFNNDIPFIVSDLKLHKRKRSIETSLTFPEGAQVFALKDGFGVQYLGLKYAPSIVYRVRTLRIEDDTLNPEIPPIGGFDLF